jgi:type IV secretory pathway VirD2 relaxase
MSKAGFKATARQHRSPGAFGKGRAAAATRGRKLGPRARRVVLKSRFVVLAKAGQKSVAAHLRYIERDGTTREGGRGQAYGPDTDTADLKVFEERGRGDRHQFRMILSAEDAGQLEDLKRFTREFMSQVSVDLQTPLDWVAVDHWDTDNPHTHIVLRGRSHDGADLVIAPEYMAHGMRMRASDIATQWLGPRTELEIRESLREEVAKERLTSLDQTLLRLASEDVLRLDQLPARQRDTAYLASRLERLRAMGLAERLAPDQWRLVPNLREVLQAMGERGDIVRAVNRGLAGERREIAVAMADKGTVIGRIAAKGVADELTDQPYVVVDGIDGRAHYVRLPAGTDLGAYPQDSIVQIDRSKGVQARARMLCQLAIEEQVQAIGPTWLDRQLVRSDEIAGFGFGEAANNALRARLRVLADRGVVGSTASNSVPPDLLVALRTRELTIVARQLSANTGKPVLPISRQPSGAAVRQLTLGSGRFAVVESELGFSLVPWRKDLGLNRSARISR